MLPPTSRPRRRREWEEDANRIEGVLTAGRSTDTSPPEPTMASPVLPSTETPPPIHTRKTLRRKSKIVQGKNITVEGSTITTQENIITVQGGRSLQSQEGERNRALAAWKNTFGDQQDRQVHLGHAESVPLQVVRHLGRGGGGSVDETSLDGVAVAWKRISTSARFLTEEEMNEVKILGEISKRRHRHIVELIGSYTRKFQRGIELGMLIWPVAHCDLGHFLRDLDYLGDSLRLPPKANITSEDLEYVMDNLYPLISPGEPLRKHPDDRQYRHELYQRALTYLRSRVGCIGQAVAYLHQSGIRHKDLKPAQVLLSGSGLWLTDFGWSKDISQFTNSVTSGGDEITLKYHAPERTAGKPCGRPEDIFALGCMFLEIGYRLLRKDPRTTDIRLPWTAKKSFSASLENVDSWIAPFSSQPHESLQHFGHVIKQMLHIEPRSRPTIAGVLEMLSMPYRKPGYTKISNPFVSSCCVPERWASFRDVNDVLVPQQLHTIVDSIAQKIIRKWVKQSDPLSRNTNDEVSMVQNEDGSISGLYYMSEDVYMSDADSPKEREPQENRDISRDTVIHAWQDEQYVPGDRQSLLGASGRWPPLPRVVTPVPDHLLYFNETPNSIQMPSFPTQDFTLFGPQQSWPNTQVDHSERQVDVSPYQPSLDTENSTDGFATFDGGMTLYPVAQPDGSISVEAYYPPDYSLRGRRLGTLEKDKALELLAKANNKPVKLVTITRDDGRRSVTPAPPSPNPGRRASLQSTEENPGSLWGTQEGNSQPQFVPPRRNSIDRQYLAPNDSGYGQISSQPEPSLSHPYLQRNPYSDQPLFRCIFCGFESNDEKTFVAHDGPPEYLHGLPSQSPQPQDRNSIRSSPYLERNQSLSPKPLWYLETAKCNDCSTEFTGSHRFEELVRHKRQQHEAHGLSWPCEAEGCWRVFRRKAEQIKHYKRRHPHLIKASPSPQR